MISATVYTPHAVRAQKGKYGSHHGVAAASSHFSKKNKKEKKSSSGSKVSATKVLFKPKRPSQEN